MNKMQAGQVDAPLAQARSFLFVPGNKPDRFAKAMASGADAVILDLEDAISPDQKHNARDEVAQAWSGLNAVQRSKSLVRINPIGTPWYDDDLRLLASLRGLGGAMLPKAQAPDEMEAIHSKLPGLSLLPLIETGEGLAQVDRLARAPNVFRLSFGHLDFQADLAMSCSEDQAELASARLAIVVASRRAELVSPVDGITVSTTDDLAILAEAQRSKRFGFSGKLCIHPAQLKSTHIGLSPSEQESDWARRVLNAWALSGSGVFAVDGKMVDAPVLLRAKQILQVSRPPS